jgi:predicted ATPase
MHLRAAKLHSGRFPVTDAYPFDVPALASGPELTFPSAVTFLVGENGTGKSTLLRAIARRCGIHIWEGPGRRRFTTNRWKETLHRFLEVEWIDGPVPGSFFAAELFRSFAQNLDDWASSDPGVLGYYGDRSLMDCSHGQSHLAYFENRYRVRGLYLLDEPENALSPARQVGLVKLLRAMGRAGHAQFIIATHSPIIMACPGATIYSLDQPRLTTVAYEHTDHYRIYRQFLHDPHAAIEGADERLL